MQDKFVVEDFMGRLMSPSFLWKSCLTAGGDHFSLYIPLLYKSQLRSPPYTPVLALVPGLQLITRDELHLAYFYSQAQSFLSPLLCITIHHHHPPPSLCLVLPSFLSSSTSHEVQFPLLSEIHTFYCVVLHFMANVPLQGST